MKATVGYITAWRRWIFFSFIGAIVLFGIVNTLAQAYIEPVLVKNVLGVFALLVGIFIVILAVADRKGRFEGEGYFKIENEIVSYRDKKRSFSINKGDIRKIDIKPVYFGQNEKKPLAFNVVIDTGKKKYYIESDRARGRSCEETDLYKLYLHLQENI